MKKYKGRLNKKIQNKLLVLGITGGYGSGKTTVAGMFKALGAPCLDADRIYHQLLKPGTDIYKQIVAIYGKGVLGRRGQIDRKKLAALVFGRKVELSRLCRITHPPIIKELKIRLRQLKKAKRAKVVIIDAPLLIEAGLGAIADILIVVSATLKKQIARTVGARKIPECETIKRIKCQIPLTEKVKLADFVINNSGNLARTKSQVLRIWRTIGGQKWK